jgi:hypothetical protein
METPITSPVLGLLLIPAAAITILAVLGLAAVRGRRSLWAVAASIAAAALVTERLVPSGVPCMPLPAASLNFEILGYDLVDVQASASALTNCGGVSGGLREFGTVVQRSANVCHACIRSSVGATPEASRGAACGLSCLAIFGAVAP